VACGFGGEVLGLTNSCGMVTAANVITLSHFRLISLQVVGFLFVLAGLGGIQSVVKCRRREKEGLEGKHHITITSDVISLIW
jgi:hypothetical protein